jgi:hypothetical protein
MDLAGEGVALNLSAAFGGGTTSFSKSGCAKMAVVLEHLYMCKYWAAPWKSKTRRKRSFHSDVMSFYRSA